MDTGLLGLPCLVLLIFMVHTATATPGFFGLDDLLQKNPGISAEAEKLKFLLYQKNETGGISFQDITNSYATDLDPNLPLLLAVHGFMGSSKSRTSLTIVEAYLEKGHVNVIVVDWEDLAKGPYYSQAVSGATQAASEITAWLVDLVGQNMTTMSNVNILGFSLGGQVAGLTKKFMPKGIRVGTIIALDPAKPSYDEKSDEDRLDSEDGDFVLVVHSSGGFLAYIDPVGKIDFYPNGGTEVQPFCGEDALRNLVQTYSPADVHLRIETNLFSGILCSHYVSLVLWLETLKPEVKIVGKLCPSWEDYLSKKCDNASEVIMGEDTPRSARGSYYFKTDNVDAEFYKRLSRLVIENLSEFTKTSGMETPGITFDPPGKTKISIEDTDRNEIHDDSNKYVVESKPSSSMTLTSSCATIFLSFFTLLLLRLN